MHSAGGCWKPDPKFQLILNQLAYAGMRIRRRLFRRLWCIVVNHFATVFAPASAAPYRAADNDPTPAAAHVCGDQSDFRTFVIPIPVATTVTRSSSFISGSEVPTNHGVALSRHAREMVLPTVSNSSDAGRSRRNVDQHAARAGTSRYLPAAEKK